uniref:WD repeat-containing protein 55 homolog n=1 Tax=Timema californicum TaxID=61474 RepID=A0A7R9J3U1_TIMCA|nr:unnamed protein product [Timema californicum]
MRALKDRSNEGAGVDSALVRRSWKAWSQYAWSAELHSVGIHNVSIEEAHNVDTCLLKARMVEDNKLLNSQVILTSIWDMRKKDPIFSRKEMDDYVSKMVTTEAKRYLVCSSGEGTITSINLVSHKLHMQSEMYDTELTSLCLMRSDSKLLVGSSKGTMFLFNWGQFGYHSDEFPGVKQSINSMIPITENIVVTACEDGVLRATHLFPQRHLGVAGQHQFSVECLDISGDGTFIASSSHDQLIKFWNIRYFEEMNINSRVKSKKREEMKRNLPSSKFQDCSAFFSELA